MKTQMKFEILIANLTQPNLVSRLTGAPGFRRDPPRAEGGIKMFTWLRRASDCPARALRSRVSDASKPISLKSLVVKSVRTPIDSFSVGVP